MIADIIGECPWVAPDGLRRRVSGDRRGAHQSPGSAGFSQTPDFMDSSCRCDGDEDLGSGEPERPALACPVERDIGGAQKLAPSELWRLPPFHDGCEYVRSEPGDTQ